MNFSYLRRRRRSGSGRLGRCRAGCRFRRCTGRRSGGFGFLFASREKCGTGKDAEVFFHKLEKLIT